MTRTPTYRLELTATGGTYTPSAWSGRATAARLAHYIADFEASTRSDGVNAHLGIVHVWNAQIVRQADDEVVATYASNLAFVAV